MIDADAKVTDNAQLGHLVHHRAIYFGVTIGEVTFHLGQDRGIGGIPLPAVGHTLVTEHLHDFIVELGIDQHLIRHGLLLLGEADHKQSRSVGIDKLASAYFALILDGKQEGNQQFGPQIRRTR